MLSTFTAVLAATVTAIVGATVVRPDQDGASATLPQSTVIIEGNRIRAVGLNPTAARFARRAPASARARRSSCGSRSSALAPPRPPEARSY